MWGGRGSRRLSIFVICSEDNDENDDASVLSHKLDNSDEECHPGGVHPSSPVNGNKSIYIYISRCEHKKVVHHAVIALSEIVLQGWYILLSVALASQVQLIQILKMY